MYAAYEYCVLVIVSETVLKLIFIFALVLCGESAGTHIDWLRSYPVGPARFSSRFYYSCLTVFV